MPGFVTHSLDPAAARAEVADLRALLVENADLKESALRRFFRERLDASVLIGYYNPAVQRTTVSRMSILCSATFVATWR